jgi:hypothetical protein
MTSLTTRVAPRIKIAKHLSTSHIKYTIEFEKRTNENIPGVVRLQASLPPLKNARDPMLNPPNASLNIHKT